MLSSEEVGTTNVIQDPVEEEENAHNAKFAQKVPKIR